jgi:hypothetical protein
MKVKLMQTDYLYNIDDEDRDLHYTVALMEDISPEGSYINYEFFDDEGEEVEDEEVIMRLMEAIENSRS